jgi:hypothetical protein
MEKRFREYIRHFEKLDYDVLSEEEIANERQGLQLEIGMLHQELVRSLISFMGFLICTCIFLSGAMSHGNIYQLFCAAVMAVAAIVISITCKRLGDAIKKLSVYADKLAQLQH